MSYTKKRKARKKNRKKNEEKMVQLELDQRQVVGYGRVSTDKQETDGYGLDTQLKLIKDYAIRHEMKVDEIYQEAFTGKINEREQFELLMDDIKANKIKTLITYKLDRLGRSQLNVLNFVNLLKEYSVKLVTLEPEVDYDTQAGQIILSNLTMFAELERNMIIDRTENGRRQKFNTGCKAQGSILGYNHNKKTKCYQVDSEEKETVLKIYHDFLVSKSLAGLKAKLDNEGIMTKRGKSFSRQALHVVLTNRFYLGYVNYKGEEKQGQHKAIINPVLFGRIQAKLERKRKG